MSKMICMSEEDYDQICKAVFVAHDAIDDMLSDYEGEFGKRGRDAIVEINVAMMRIDDIDDKLSKEE